MPRPSARLQPEQVLDAKADQLDHVAAQISDQTGAVLLAAEAFADVAAAQLMKRLREQPKWSDLPLLVVTGQHSPERAPLILRQSLDNHRLVDGLTKWTVTASGRIHQVLASASN